MNKHFKIILALNLLLTWSCFAQTNDYETGNLKDGYKDSIWSYYDKPGVLSLKIDYTHAQLLYLQPDTSDFAIKVNNEWVESRLKMQPRYIGSMVEFYNILRTQIRYPQDARENSTNGTFCVTFEIDTNGSIGNFKVINDIGDGCSEEAIRVLKLIPNYWLVASRENKKFAAKFILPFNFQMELDGKKIAEVKRKKNIKETLLLAKALDTVGIKVVGVTRSKKIINGIDGQQMSTYYVNSDTTKTLNGKPVYTIVEEMPQFPGGEEFLLKFLQVNIRYPVDDRDKGIQGIVYVSFVVDSLGNVENLKILRGVSKAIDEEALRVIKMMPLWTPGKQNGRPVNVQYNIPMRFSIKGSETEEDHYDKKSLERFTSSMHIKIDQIIKNDFRMGRTQDYAIGNNDLSIMFLINKEGKAEKFNMITSWGQQFYQTLIFELGKGVKFHPSNNPMYFHLRVHLNEGKIYEYSFNFSEEVFHYE